MFYCNGSALSCPPRIRMSSNPPQPILGKRSRDQYCETKPDLQTKETNNVESQISYKIVHYNNSTIPQSKYANTCEESEELAHELSLQHSTTKQFIDACTNLNLTDIFECLNKIVSIVFCGECKKEHIKKLNWNLTIENNTNIVHHCIISTLIKITSKTISTTEIEHYDYLLSQIINNIKCTSRYSIKFYKSIPVDILTVELGESIFRGIRKKIDNTYKCYNLLKNFNLYQTINIIGTR